MKVNAEENPFTHTDEKKAVIFNRKMLQLKVMRQISDLKIDQQKVNHILHKESKSQNVRSWLLTE